jgi:hypothetical protein
MARERFPRRFLMRRQAILDGRKRRRRGMQNWEETSVLVCEAKESVQIKCLGKACVLCHWLGLAVNSAGLSQITTFVLAPLIIGRLCFGFDWQPSTGNHAPDRYNGFGSGTRIRYMYGMNFGFRRCGGRR